MSRQILGQYIVADSKICHGQLTYVGTRILVEDVLYMVGMGMDWKEIVRQWHNSITEEGIAEIADLSHRGTLDAWLRAQGSRTILLQQAGALAEDETLPSLRAVIYDQRGRPEVD